MTRLANRTILITGAGSGIGRAVSLSLAKEQATVILLGKTEKDLNSLYDEIINNGFPIPAIIPFDLSTTNPNSAQELYEIIEREFGKLDSLIHNAAILGNLTPIEHYLPEKWMTVQHVNVNSAFFLTQALLPILKKSPKASIIFTTDYLGKKAKAYWGAYAVSKFAIEGLSQILKEELEINTNIKVNCINPGPVKTKLRACAYPYEDTSNLAAPEDIVE